MLAGLSAVAFGQPEPKQRPFLLQPPFSVLTTDDPDKLYAGARGEFAKGLAALAATYKPGGRTNSENSGFYNTLANAVKVYEANGSRECLAIAVAMLKAATAECYDMSERELRGRIDEEGAFNPLNIEMKEHCYDLALLYHLTRDKRAARQAATILDRYNAVIRKWPLKEREGDKRYSQDDQRFKDRWDATGLYGGWIPGFVRRGFPLLYAFDLIHDSGVMEELGVRKSAESVIRYHIEFSSTFSHEYGNLDHYDLIGYSEYGLLLPEPEYIHEVVQWLDNLLHYGFYVSGFWHEGSPSYHKDITVGLTRSVPALLNGYSDPPGFTSKLAGTRYDNLNLTQRYYTQFRRMWDSLGKVTLPNRNCAVIHDTSFVQQAWWMPAMTHSSPKLLGCMGHVILAKGEGPDQQQAHLHFSGMHGHEHLDSLHIMAWSQGQEMISSTRYRPLPDDVSTREWHGMTAGQNTVVIDETSQLSRLSSHRRKITEIDAFPFPDPRYRAYGHGDSLTDGKLRLFAAQWAPVQMAEAQGEEAYHGLADLYRRTLVMVEVDPQHAYLVDVFRVRGGQMHDWMLHGCLELPYTVATELPLAAIEGNAHRYIDQLRVADLPEVANFRFVYEDGKQSRHWLLMPDGSRLYVGRGPAMRRLGYNPFTFVRHSAHSSLFVAVHEFWSGGEQPRIASVQPMQMVMADVMDAGVQIDLADGTKDLFVSRFEPDAETSALCVGAGLPIEMRGRAVHIRLAPNGAVARAFGVGLSTLQVGDIKIADGTAAYTGVVTRTQRKETGDALDALYTAAQLPADGSLNGAPVILQYGDELVQSFFMDHIQALPQGGSLIVLQEDAGITIEDNGKLTKLHYFPGWGIRGECRFTIVNTVLDERTAEGGLQVTSHPKSRWPEPVESGITYWKLD